MAGVRLYVESSIQAADQSSSEGGSPSRAAARFTPPELPNQVLETPAAAPVPASIFPSPTFAVASPSFGAGRAAATARPSSTSPSRGKKVLAFVPNGQRQPSASLPHALGPRRMSVPPPRKVGEVLTPAAYYNPQYEREPKPTAPPNLSLRTALPPPITAPLLSQGALGSNTAIQMQPRPALSPIATSGSATVPDLTHPPGYMQDSRASFCDVAPASSSENISPISQHGANSSTSHGRCRPGVGILGGGHQDDMADEEEKGLWDTAVTWAKTMGKKVVQGEEEVWKRINGLG